MDTNKIDRCPECRGAGWRLDLGRQDPVVTCRSCGGSGIAYHSLELSLGPFAPANDALMRFLEATALGVLDV